LREVAKFPKPDHLGYAPKREGAKAEPHESPPMLSPGLAGRSCKLTCQKAAQAHFPLVLTRGSSVHSSVLKRGSSAHSSVLKRGSSALFFGEKFVLHIIHREERIQRWGHLAVIQYCNHRLSMRGKARKEGQTHEPRTPNDKSGKERGSAYLQTPDEGGKARKDDNCITTDSYRNRKARKGGACISTDS
jgi:hypothetical protein